MRHDTTNSDAATREDYGPLNAVLNRLSAVALPFGFIGLVGLAIGFFMDHFAFWTSFLFAFAFWTSLTMGFTTLTYLHHSVRATWTLSFLRIIEAGNRTLPYIAFLWLFIAIGVGTNSVYEWTNIPLVAHSPILHHKALYLNPGAWIFRGVFYFAYWILTTRFLNKSSLLQDETMDESLGQLRGSYGAVFGVFHVILITFAATDWFMSLDPIYYSTIYAVIYMMAGVLAATALGAIFITSQAAKYPFSVIVTPALTRNVGNMLLGFTMFWAYTSLAQFLIQWCANLPEEVSFYTQRFVGPLVFVGGAIVILQFITPFMALLSGRTKRTYDVLLKVAILIVCVRVVDCWWQITPFFRRGFSSADLGGLALDLAAWAGVGGVWIAVFVREIKKYPLLVTHDPRLIEAKAKAHH